MSERDPKIVVADRPVNRRTALREVQERERAALPRPARVLAVQARNRLGAPLATLQSAPPALTTGTRIAGGVLASLGAVGGFLAWLNAAPVAGLLAGAAFLGGGLLAIRRPAGANGLAAAAPGAWLDAGAVQAFDRAIEALGPELSAPLQERVAGVKQTLLRILRHPAGAEINEHFRLEDRLYVNECLHRYLPDSLQAYVAVPAAQRAAGTQGTQSAEQMLLAQLALLQEELARREAALGRSAAEALLRQQRFLDAKARD